MTDQSRIHRNTYQEYFTILSNGLFEDENLSWGAKGLVGYLLSRPENWKVYRAHLAKIYKGEKRGNGKDAIDSYFKELMDLGYIVYTPKDENTGQYIHRYDVYPEPLSSFQKKFPKRVKPDMVLSTSGLNRRQTSNNSKQSNDTSFSHEEVSPDQAMEPDGSNKACALDERKFLSSLGIEESLIQKLKKEYGTQKLSDATSRLKQYQSIKCARSALMHEIRGLQKPANPKPEPSKGKAFDLLESQIPSLGIDLIEELAAKHTLRDIQDAVILYKIKKDTIKNLRVWFKQSLRDGWIRDCAEEIQQHKAHVEIRKKLKEIYSTEGKTAPLYRSGEYHVIGCNGVEVKYKKSTLHKKNNVEKLIKSFNENSGLTKSLHLSITYDINQPKLEIL